MKSPSREFVSTIMGSVASSSGLDNSSASRWSASRRLDKSDGIGLAAGSGCGVGFGCGFGFGVGFNTASRLTFARGFGSGFGTDTFGTGTVCSVDWVIPSSILVARWLRYDSFVRDVSPERKVNAISAIVMFFGLSSTNRDALSVRFIRIVTGSSMMSNGCWSMVVSSMPSTAKGLR